MSDKTINELVELTDVSQTDELIIYDSSETEGNPTKKVKVENLLKNNYSTEETLTGGKWIDGKPIYRKVFKFTTQCTHLTEFSLPYANNLIQCYLCTPENAYFSCSPYVYPVNTVGQSNFAIKCTWSNDTNWQSSQGFLIADYTKTTD